MTTNVVPDAILTLTLDGVDYSCQLLDASYTQPGAASAETLQVACGDTVTIPAADLEDGRLTGNVLKDASSAGITRALAAWVEAGSPAVPFTYVENPGTTAELRFIGKVTARPFAIPFTPGAKAGRHAVDLAVVESALGTAVPADGTEPN